MSNHGPGPGEVLKAFQLAGIWPDEPPARLTDLKAALIWVMTDEPQPTWPGSDSHHFFASLPRKPRPPDMGLIKKATTRVRELLSGNLATTDAESRLYYEAVHECLAWIVDGGDRPVELG
jgi:hypothetical protein